jgi:hypothetical protein
LACSGSPAPVSAAPPSADELDAAIRETSNYLNQQLPKGNKLVILNIQSEFPALSEYVIDELIANTVNDRVFSVVDRQQLNTIRAELDFQMSGEVDDDTAQALGRMSGAQIIVSGAVSRVGDLYRLRVRALKVENAQIEGQFNRNIPDCPTIAALVQSKATGYGGGTATTTARPATAPAAPAAATSSPVITYKIGDTGPAGGLIFHDKGNNSGGWRYLEAAPVSTEFKAPWGADKANINTNVDIGSGKRNTENIVKFLWDNGQNGAALLCDELSINGFNDWFLPSKGELNLMYMRLKLNSIGNFIQNWYWSSSKDTGRLVWVQRFSDGKQWDSGYYYADDIFIRAIRQF